MGLSVGRFDHGPVLRRVQLPIAEARRPLPQARSIVQDAMFSGLRDQLGCLGADALLACLSDLPAAWRAARPQVHACWRERPVTSPQSEFPEAPSLARKLDREAGRIDWQADTAAHVRRKFRALSEQAQRHPPVYLWLT